MTLNKNTGFLIVVLALSSLITLFSILDTVFLWTAASQQKWGIATPEASRMISISAGVLGSFVLLFSIYLISLLLREEKVLGFVSLLGWYFLSAGVVYGLLSHLGSQFHVDFGINVARGALLLIGVRMAKKRSKK